MAGGTTEAATVRGDYVISGMCERRDDFAPGIAEFREAVEQDNERSISGRRVVGFQDVDRERIVLGGKGNLSGGYDRVHGGVLPSTRGI